jgi:hypothetical protein
MAALAGVDFPIVEVLTWQGLITCYVLFFRSSWTWRPGAYAWPVSRGIQLKSG